MFNLENIISRLKDKFNRYDILLIPISIISYCATRLINLDKFPIFSDEGIYIHWAKLAWHDASWRFVSLTDGKQPLQTWGTIPFLKLIPDNALFAGRLFSFSTGMVAMIGVFILLYYLFGKKSAYIGVFLYIFTPYFLFYDRMALVDSGVNAGFIWILFFSILLSHTQRLDVALLFGFVAGISLLAKSSVRLFLGLSALAPILYLTKNIRYDLKKIVNHYFLLGLSVIIGLVIYNVQRLSPFLHFVELKNRTFIMGLDEFIKTPFAYFSQNIITIPSYVISEATVLLTIAGLIGLILLIKQKRALGLYLLLWFVLPLVIIAVVTKVLFPRYIIFFGTLLLVCSAYFLSQLKNIKIVIIGLIIFLISVFYYDYTIIFDYKNIPFPKTDRGQYLEGWPAGWGIREIVDYARNISKTKPVLIIAEGNFGMSGDVLDVSLKPSDTNIAIKGYWPLDDSHLTANFDELKKKEVLVVFSHTSIFPKHWPIKLIKKFEKPGNESAIYLFELVK